MIFTSFWLTLQGIIPPLWGFGGMLVGYIGPESAETVLVNIGQQAFADATAQREQRDQADDSDT
jgi:hypothetical protein